MRLENYIIWCRQDDNLSLDVQLQMNVHALVLYEIVQPDEKFVNITKDSDRVVAEIFEVL